MDLELATTFLLEKTPVKASVSLMSSTRASLTSAGMSSLDPKDAVADYSSLTEAQVKTLDQWEAFFEKVRPQKSPAAYSTDCSSVTTLWDRSASRVRVCPPKHEPTFYASKHKHSFHALSDGPSSCVE